jgi:hypothetical protein
MQNLRDQDLRFTLPHLGYQDQNQKNRKGWVHSASGKLWCNEGNEFHGLGVVARPAGQSESRLWRSPPRGLRYPGQPSLTTNWPNFPIQPQSFQRIPTSHPIDRLANRFLKEEPLIGIIHESKLLGPALAMGCWMKLTKLWFVPHTVSSRTHPISISWRLRIGSTQYRCPRKWTESQLENRVPLLFPFSHLDVGLESVV